jgi:hypothetical protein
MNSIPYKTCHPEALLLREGSPAMVKDLIAAGVAFPPGTPQYGPKGLASAFKSVASREILRPKEGLQDDRV